MKLHKLDAYIVPSEDSHQSEYVTEHDKRRAYISNFTGSAGIALITNEKALLWTDGRYFLQADMQLDKSSWSLMKMGIDLQFNEYISKNFKKEDKIGIDGNTISVESYKKLKSDIQSNIVFVKENLIDLIWENQPKYPNNPIFKLSDESTGKSYQDKFKEIREKMKEKSCEYLVLTALDEIAWILNMRGSDISFNPVFLSYFVLSHEKAYLFCDQKLDVNDIEVKPYSSVFEFLSTIKDKVWIDVASTSIAVYNSIQNPFDFQSPIVFPKAIKNEKELQGMRNCQVRDGAAVCKFFNWMENQLKDGKKITEYQAAEQLEKFRAEQKDFITPSFETIAGMGPNGAIIHYKPEEDSAVITTDSLFLLDSGGQYLDGTTDTTRTVHFGTPTSYQKECFTNVLKGHISLDTAIFPKGTSGGKLDILARMHLWKYGQDYRHGTGHGVGHFLNVHEGPHGIGARASASTPLEPNMVVTNEPGYYEDQNFGIRIENILIVKNVDTKYKTMKTDFYGFEHITCVPMQTKLIEKDLLTKDELKWINDYNHFCFEKLKNEFKQDSEEYTWLKENTKSI